MSAGNWQMLIWGEIMKIGFLVALVLTWGCGELEEKKKNDRIQSGKNDISTVSEEEKLFGESEEDSLELGRGKYSILDFLIQDVCLDRRGRVLVKDPAKCKKRRNIRSYEKLPYQKIDMGPGFPKRKTIGWQRSDSVPMRASNGKWYILKSFDFGGPHFRGKSWGKFEDHQDGWDITELNGPYVSYIGTKDGTNDNAWSGANCKLDDGWVLFPKYMRKHEIANKTHDIYGVHVRKNCHAGMRNQAHAAWHWLPKKISYSGGQKLETITTHHWSHPTSTASTSFEMNYYTREYGATRWEAWVKCTDQRNCVAPKAANNCHGKRVATINGAKWKRTGCRDWTYIQLGWKPQLKEFKNLVDYRLCLYGKGQKFGDGKTCLKR